MINQTRKDAWEDLQKIIPLVIAAVFMAMAFYWYGTEKSFFTAFIFTAYGGILNYYPLIRAKTILGISLHFTLVGLVCLSALYFYNKSTNPRDFSPEADQVYARFLDRDETLKYPCAVEVILSGVSVGNFKRDDILRVCKSKQEKVLTETLDEFCQENELTAKQEAQILIKIKEKYMLVMENSRQSYLNDALFCLKVNYDLNMYLETPTDQHRIEIVQKYNIKQNTLVKDITQPNFPTSPPDGLFWTWFSKSHFYNIHTIKILEITKSSDSINEVSFQKIN